MARFVPLCLCLALVIIVIVTGSMGSPPAATPASASKINPLLHKTLASKDRVNILVSMKESNAATLAQLDANIFPSRSEKAAAVYTSLKTFADNCQGSVLKMIHSPRLFPPSHVRTFWISNQIYIQNADKELINDLAENEDVGSIDEEVIIRLENPVLKSSLVNEDDSTQLEWGIEKIDTQDAWNLTGSQGEGVIVGIIDTGARYTHELLIDSYKNDNFSWYDPYNNEPNPTDGFGHGTHVTGTIAGSGGIGVAPGAKWIACKGLRDDGSGTNAGLLACGEFIACPHDPQGNNPDCSQAPEICSNSWGGNGGDSWYDSTIEVWHAVGIIPVFANGNFGPGCSTTASPADSAADVIAVAATTPSDGIASFSSRGPANSGSQKPQLSAPGVDIRSASNESDTGLVTLSGTSMACPHVSGVAALMLASNPNITYVTLKNILQDNADRNLEFSNEICDGVNDSTFPNFIFGFGRLNAFRAVNATLAMMN